MATKLHGPPTTAMPPKAPTKKRPFLVEFYATSMGKKFAMAVSGLVGLGFVVGHLVGNLKTYLGAEEIYNYGEFLRDVGYPLLPHTVLLWIARFVLIGALVVHVHAAYSLTMTNRKSRPKNYESNRDWVVANFASRTTRWTGIIILLYLGFHLADLTWGLQPAAADGWERGQIYANMTASMGRPIVALIYIVANTALAIHIFHGTWSLFQTMGWNNKRFNHLRRGLAVGLGAFVLVGNLSFPILIQAGAVEPDSLFGQEQPTFVEGHSEEE